MENNKQINYRGFKHNVTTNYKNGELNINLHIIDGKQLIKHYSTIIYNVSSKQYSFFSEMDFIKSYHNRRLLTDDELLLLESDIELKQGVFKITRCGNNSYIFLIRNKLIFEFTTHDVYFIKVGFRHFSRKKTIHMLKTFLKQCNMNNEPNINKIIEMYHKNYI